MSLGSVKNKTKIKGRCFKVRGVSIVSTRWWISSAYHMVCLWNTISKYPKEKWFLSQAWRKTIEEKLTTLHVGSWGNTGRRMLYSCSGEESFNGEGISVPSSSDSLPPPSCSELPQGIDFFLYHPLTDTYILSPSLWALHPLIICAEVWCSKVHRLKAWSPAWPYSDAVGTLGGGL